MNKMHSLFLAIALLTGLSLSAQTEYKFNAKPNGFSIGNRSTETTTIVHNVSAITIENAHRDNMEGQFITLSGIHIANTAGAPDLPSGSAFVAIPNGAQPTVSMVNARTKTINNVDLIPAPQPQLDDDDSPAVYQKDMSIYGRNAFYPSTPYNISEVMTIRGVQMVKVGVMPFQYNPVTKELIVYEDIELQLTTEGGDGTYGDLRYRTPEWDQILSDMLLNREALPQVDYNEKLRKHYENRETGCEYMIITPDNEGFLQLADSIKQFRTAQGIPTEVFTVTQCGGNNGTSIRNFIRNAYNNWDMPPAAVLILGDHSTDGIEGVVSYTMNNHPGGSGYNPYISDHKYAVMGSDHMPEIIVGRITGRDYEEMRHMINKDIDYERNPPTNPDFYDKPVTAMGFQLERWFQLCSEVVNGFWEHELGKHPVRINAIYQGNPGSQWSSANHTNTVLNYFGPNGYGYIPSTMSHLTEWHGTGNDVNDAINNGAFLLQHRDHGAEELWGEPSYSIGYIKRLTNNDLTYVMSNNCLTGRFNYGGMNGEGCFAEVFHRHQHGALGLIAATQVSYSFVNDVYVWGVYDNMWPEFMSYGTQHATNFILPAFGNAAGKYFLSQSSWTDDGVKQITYYLFHQHGDVYMNLYSEMPQHLDVEMLPVLPAGNDYYQVKADEGAIICLTANGQIIGFAEATGEVQNIAITPQEVGTRVLLTIRKQNYYRYEHELATIATDEPYLIFNSLEINDEEGNNNQAPDYNETCKLNVGIHNVGFANVNQVQAVLTCSHPEVQIIDSEASFGNINAGDMPIVNNAFTLHFGETLQDGETVKLHLQLWNDTFVFNDSIDLTINAPVLNCIGVSLTDLNGSPTDRFFKGESALMTFSVTNSGHSQSLDLTNFLDIHAPFLDITENTLPIDPIEAGETVQVTFQVNIHNDAPKGNILSYAFNAMSGTRTALYENQISLGYTTEDFEDEELNTGLEWNLGSGNKKWYIIEDETATEGHCLSSPTLNNSGTAKVTIAIRCPIAETFTFRHKTSTEPGDKLTLNINGSNVESWYGISDWEESTYDLCEGANVIKFTFKKDAQDSGGDDRVMIDHLLFPPLADLYVLIEDEAERCSSEPYTPTNNYILNAKEIVWSTNGDGTFNDPSLENPTYTYGANDINTGMVVLNMTATSGLNNYQQSKDVTLIVTEDFDGGAPAMPTGETLIDPETVTTTTYHANLPQNYVFTWSFTPEEAGSITPNNESVTIHWNNQFEGDAYLSYEVSNECSDSAPSEPLHIQVTVPTSVNSDLTTDAFEVYPNPSQGTIHIKAGDMISGSVLIRLIDPLGRVVYSKEQSTEGNAFEGHINASNMRSGIYELQLINGSRACNTRVIIR